MDMLSFCHWLQSTGWAVWIKESFNVFPALYVVHIFGFILLVASTSILDMRMLGWWVRGRSVSNVVDLTLPWAKVGFASNFITGVVLFATHAVDMYTNTAFRVKMLLVLGAGLNILLFQITTYRSVEEWGQSEGDSGYFALLVARDRGYVARHRLYRSPAVDFRRFEEERISADAE